MNEQELIQSCERFCQVWHENERADFERWHTNLKYDEYAPKTIKIRRDYICLDRGNDNNRSGVYMVRKSDGEVFTIKAYGRINRPIGHIGDLITQLALANVDNRHIRPEIHQ